MREREFVDLETGKLWLFIVRRPKGDEGTLTIQPPEGTRRASAPHFELSRVIDFLLETDQP